MNLHAITSGSVSVVNPWVWASIQKSTGYTTSTDGTQVPAYAEPVQVKAQKQSLLYNDMVQIDGLNIQGERCAMYLQGNWEGVVREDQSGGDIITLPDGTIWLVVMVLENWQAQDGWVKVACTRQMS